jgi:GNAT superfamily N-acetyltransferase
MQPIDKQAGVSPSPSQNYLIITISRRSGEHITLRPLQPDDAVRLGAYFAGLSAETRARYGPHPFDQATADTICATLDPSDILRLVATVPHDSEERIIAYFLLKHGLWDKDRQRYEQLGIALNPETDCTFAPSVADDYQNGGVGSLMMSHVLRVAAILGRTRIVLWGGVQATNSRAIHFYTKSGFVKVGEFFTDKNNYDMFLTLPSGGVTRE